MKSFSALWTVANAIGFAVGFALFLLITERLIGHKNTTTAFWGHFTGLLIFGAFLGFIQSLVLRRHNIHTGKWIVSGILGFVLVMAVIWPLYLTKTWPAAGPVEPLVISLTACFFLGLMVFLFYRKQLLGIGKFFVWWLVGVITGISISAGLMVLLVTKLKLGLPFVIDMAIFTLSIG
ncbi:MAG: hypothetical protein ABR503_16555, partial [Chitinophagaceae bacterium]